jgi:hypothetical protein
MKLSVTFIIISLVICYSKGNILRPRDLIKDLIQLSKPSNQMINYYKIKPIISYEKRNKISTIKVKEQKKKERRMFLSFY